MELQVSFLFLGQVYEEYAWSSAQFHLGLLAADPLVKDRTLLGLVEDCAEYRVTPITQLAIA